MSKMSCCKRGRRPLVEKQVIIESLIKRSENLILPNKKVISKSNEIWSEISKELGNAVSPNSLYVIVTCNRFQVRDRMTMSENVHDESHFDSIPNSNSPSFSNCSEMENINNQSMESDIDTGEFRKYVLHIPRQEFESLIIIKKYKKYERSAKKNVVRIHKTLMPGLWEDMITEKLARQTPITCGYNFVNHYISMDTRSGKINANCNCGGKLRALIDNSGPEVEVTCNISKGENKCGKRWLRGKTRHKIARAIEEKSAHIYRAQRANREMCPGDIEPPNLYSSPVLRKAKSEYISSQYLDRDPVKSIFLSKLTTGANIIQNIGLDPFYVHYWTSHQMGIYKKYCSKYTSCLFIDATGGVVRKIKKVDGSKSGSIFLYHSIIRLPGGQFSVSQMLSEVHNTNAIHYWLSEWTRSGAPMPKEVVTDASRALLSATIRAFTNCKSIEEYAESLWQKPSACYIRVDVAHFIKIYSSLVKDLPRRVRVFYLGCLGQLILCKSLTQAEKVLGSILLVSQCETEGYLPSGEPCKSEAAKHFLKEIITSSEEIDKAADTESILEKLPQEEEYTVKSYHNIWTQWGENIDKSLQTAKTEIGDRENAHFFPAMSKKLLNDLHYFPMWSCVMQSLFGYGRIPASSAPVEGEFNKIKSHLLSGITSPLRADVFVNRHVDYLSGRMKIIQSKMDDNDTAKKSLTSEYSGTSEQCTGATHASGLILVNREEIAEEGPYSACPACRNEDQPSGAHKCIICSKSVHALDSCSISFKGSVEGYGQSRICFECDHKGGTSVILASREEENWKGLTISTKPKRIAKYLQNNNYNLNEQLASEKNRKLLVIKNGSNLSLGPIALGDRNVYVIFTCTFDSIYQIILAALCDRKQLLESISQITKDNPLLTMVLDVLENGLRASSYKKRAAILHSIFSGKEQPDGSLLINCQSSVMEIIKPLFKKTPSFQETIRCSSNCPVRINTLVCPYIDIQEIKKKGFEIQDILKFSDNTICGNENCSGSTTSEISFIGEIVLFELGYQECHATKLKEIPVYFKNPLNNTENYQLVGLVNYIPPPPKRRSSESQDIGHSTAYCLRGGYQWVEYDDLKKNETNKQFNNSVQPVLLVFVRNKI